MRNDAAVNILNHLTHPHSVTRFILLLHTGLFLNFKTLNPNLYIPKPESLHPGMKQRYEACDRVTPSSQHYDQSEKGEF